MLAEKDIILPNGSASPPSGLQMPPVGIDWEQRTGMVASCSPRGSRSWVRTGLINQVRPSGCRVSIDGRGWAGFITSAVGTAVGVVVWLGYMCPLRSRGCWGCGDGVVVGECRRSRQSKHRRRGRSFVGMARAPEWFGHDSRLRRMEAFLSQRLLVVVVLHCEQVASARQFEVYVMNSLAAVYSV